MAFCEPAFDHITSETQGENKLIIRKLIPAGSNHVLLTDGCACHSSGLSWLLHEVYNNCSLVKGHKRGKLASKEFWLSQKGGGGSCYLRAPTKAAVWNCVCTEAPEWR